MEIVIQLLGIFEDVHSAGFTYNDLKPANIMLNNDKYGNLHVTLVDFGFAKQFRATTDKKGANYN